MDSYEFSEAENQTIGRLALRMRGVGFWFEVLGIVKLAGALAPILLDRGQGNIRFDFAGTLTGLFFLVLGYWTRRAGWSFQVIIDSKGNDIAFLMDALGNLLKFYLLLDTLILAVVAILIITFGVYYQ